MSTPSAIPNLPRLRDHTTDRRMLMLALAAVVVGTGGAFGAWLLLKLIALSTNLFWFGRFSFVSSEIIDNQLGWLALLIPVIGSLIIGLMARYGSEKIRGHGIPEAIEAILFGESRLSLKVAVLKPLSSAISIGSGGPFGAEGPIIMTGGAIGSLFAQLFELSAAERKTLLVSGATAGMTAIFGTPMAAILLALEVLLFEWKPRSFIPVVVAVLVSTAWRPFLISSGPLFPFMSVDVSGGMPLLFALLLGAVVGIQSVLLSTGLYRIEDMFHRLPVHWMWWPALGAIAVGVGGVIDPNVLGAGYASIQQLLDGSMTLKAIALLLVVKAAVWLIALGSGTSGGVLAPLLLLGGALGALIGQFLPGGAGFWAMIGMAGILSGAMRAPLTSAIFAVELTGHFAALPETIAASASAYAVSVLILNRSILTEKIARRGRHILQEYSVDPFAFLQASHVMTPSPECLSGKQSIDDTIAFFTKDARHRAYPVLDDDGRLLGLVSRSEVLQWQVSGAPVAASLAETLSDASQPTAFTSTPLGEVADLMVMSGIPRIPILDPQSHKVVGLVSRQDLLKARIQHSNVEMVRKR